MPRWAVYVEIDGRGLTCQVEDLMAIDFVADQAALKLGIKDFDRSKHHYLVNGKLCQGHNTVGRCDLLPGSKLIVKPLESPPFDDETLQLIRAHGVNYIQQKTGMGAGMAAAVIDRAAAEATVEVAAAKKTMVKMRCSGCGYHVPCDDLRANGGKCIGCKPIDPAADMEELGIDVQDGSL
jgi:hypothetical protein